MCGQIHYPSLASDMFVRLHDGQVSTFCRVAPSEPFSPQTKPNMCSSHSPPPTHQPTQADRVRDGQAKPAQCYIDGVASSLPTLYIEKSGA